MNVACDHFLAGTRFTRDQDRCLAGRDLVGERDHRVHGLVFEDQLVRVFRHCGENGGNQFRIRGEGDVLLRATLDRVDGCACIGANAAGHDGNVNAFVAKLFAQGCNRETHVNHQQVGAASIAQFRHGLFDRRAVGDFRSTRDGDLGCCSDLSVQLSDDKEAHGFVSFQTFSFCRP